MKNIQETFSIALSLSPIPSFPAKSDGLSSADCHGFWHNAALLLPSVFFVLFLAFCAKKNLKKLSHGRSYVMIAYYVLFWFSALLNLAWCSLQAWQCTPGKEIAWNLLSLFTVSGMLCLEISLVAFLLQENYASGLETLPRTFVVSGLIVGVDILLKAIFVFGFSVPLFIENTHRVKWGLWTIQKLLLTGVYGFILFVHYSKSKWIDKLPRNGAGFGLWLYNFTDMCYHSLYLPFIYVTFLADFFQEEDLLLDNAYYSEMKDAGFFDDDWD